MAHKVKREVSEVELPITPMLDMAFQILVFFIFSYHPSAFEVQIDGTLLPPETKMKAVAQVKGQQKPKEEASPEKPPDTGDNMVVVVEANTAKDIAPLVKKEILDKGFKVSLNDQQFEQWLDWEVKSLTQTKPPPLPRDLRDASLPALSASLKKDVVKMGEALGKPKQITLQLPSPTDEAGFGAKKVEKKGDANKPKKLMDQSKSMDQVLLDLQEELKKFLLDNLDSPAATETVVIYVKDTNLKWGYFISVWDLCKTRYGVSTAKGVKELVEIKSKKQEKDFSQIVGFKNVSYLIPAKPIGGAGQ